MSDFARDAERLRSAKVALRSRVLTARRSLPEAVRRTADRSVQASTLAWLRAARPTLCAAYVPVGTEPGGPELPDLLAGRLPAPDAVSPSDDPAVPAAPAAPAAADAPARGPAAADAVTSSPSPIESRAEACTVLLPVLLPDGDLDWATHDGTVRRSPRGLWEPTGRPLGTSAISQADLIIVPAVAVSRTGARLGRGGGSYDRALARAPSAFVIALLHDGELLDEVPTEPHDRPVNAVITPADGLVVLNPR